MRLLEGITSVVAKDTEEISKAVVARVAAVVKGAAAAEGVGATVTVTATGIIKAVATKVAVVISRVLFYSAIGSIESRLDDLITCNEMFED